MNWNWLTRDKLMGAVGACLLYPLIQQAAPFFTVGVLSSLQERATFPMLVERMEVVRRAGAAMSCPPSVADQPIVAQIMEWDLRIAHEQEANRHWWSDYFSTDRWNAVKPIALPCEFAAQTFTGNPISPFVFTWSRKPE